MRVLVSLLFMGALLGCAPAAAQSSSELVAPETIAAIESRVRMPRGAAALEEYDRYYAIDRSAGLDLVRGVFLLRSTFGDVERAGMAPLLERANVYRGMVPDLPVVADGGCAVVSVVFDARSLRFLEIERDPRDHLTAPAVCNGRA